MSHSMPGWRTCVIGMVALLPLMAAASMENESPLQVGRIVYATGNSQVLGKNGPRPAQGSIEEGEIVKTGVDGHVYLRMDDGGFFILRPDSQGRVVRYRSEQTSRRAEFRLELEQGVGRVVTGSGPKAAPERFRFNTPVAAIGVRGTDFTVETDAITTRSWVDSGRIVVARLGGECLPSGLGPCQGKASLELSPTSVRAAEVRMDLPTPRPLPGELQAPDRIPTRDPGEQVGENTLTKNGLSSSSPLTEHTLPIVETTPQPAPTLRWGRWQALADAPATIDLREAASSNQQLIAIGPLFALVREATPPVTLPLEGKAEFRLSEHEGYFVDAKNRQTTPAVARDGSLTVDFAARRFSTGLTLSANNQPTTRIEASGVIDADGRFVSQALSTSRVAGALSGVSLQEAAYLYQKRINHNVSVTGATYWGR